MSHQFLSEPWIEAVRVIREKYHGQTPAITTVIKMNQVITDVPFGEGTLELYTDTSSGDMQMELGKLEDAEVTVTTDYDTAMKIFVEQDQAAAMQAFMAGKIKVQGDMMKMMAMQTAIPQNDVTKAIADEIRSITA